jgi:heme-degrading monooxygenase HmoA
VSGALLYEVNLVVDTAIEAAFADWLDAHVRAIRALPGFTGAEVLRRREPEADAGEVVFCTHYRLRDAAAFEDYLRDHAPAMRADGIARFGAQFRAERRVLLHVAGY